MSETLMEGITILDTPSGQVNKGQLTPPPGFDNKKWVGKWVADGHAVTAAGQKEPIPSAGVAIAGWVVYRGEDGKQKPTERTLASKGKFVFCVRPKKLQQVANVLYANESRQRMIQEIKGDTVAGVPAEAQDPGILGGVNLKQSFPTLDLEDLRDPLANEGLRLNRMPVSDPNDAATLNAG